MEKEFIKYEEALALKELGFNEPCFAIHSINLMTENEDWELKIGGVWTNQELVDSIKAPLYQQCFKWFREKYAIYTNINYDWNDEVFRVTIMKQNEDKSCNIIFLKEGEYIKEYKSYEEAELECLKKLIEICKK